MGAWSVALREWKRWALFLVWLIVLLVSLKAHTPWRDEYQSWLISTRAPTSQDFFEAIRYERHPPLLYLLQRGLTRAFPAILEWPAKIAIQLVTVPFAVGAALLLVFFLNFSLAQSALLIFSPYFLREFGVISRCYTLGVFFLLAAAAFGQRKRFPLAYAMLALGSLTHLLFTWICGALFLQLGLIDRRWKRDLNFWLSGVIILGAGLLQWPPADGVFQSLPVIQMKTLVIALKGLNQSLWGLEKIWQPYEWNSMPLATDLTLALLVPAIYWLHKAIDLRRYLFVCFPPVLLVAAGSGLNLRSLGASFFGLVAAYALFKRSEPRSRLDPLLTFSFIAVFSTALWWLGWAPFDPKPKFDFSGAEELVRSGKVENALILTADETAWFSWMAVAKKEIFDMRRNRLLAYPFFKRSEYIFENADSWCQSQLAEFREKNPAEILYFGARVGDVLPSHCGKLEKVYSPSARILTDERLEVYKIL